MFPERLFEEGAGPGPCDRTPQFVGCIGGYEDGRPPSSPLSQAAKDAEPVAVAEQIIDDKARRLRQLLIE